MTSKASQRTMRIRAKLPRTARICTCLWYNCIPLLARSGALHDKWGPVHKRHKIARFVVGLPLSFRVCDMNPFATIPIEERYAEFHKRYPALNLIGNTRMVEILCFKEEFPEVRVYAKAEYTNPGGSLKDRPVRRMLLEASIEGKIGKGQVVLDSSSGNAGIAYAMLGAMMNVPVQIVVPGNASKERKLRIQAHGAKLVQTDPLEGYVEGLNPVENPGDSIPKILDQSLVDRKVRVSSAEAARMCALLARYGIFAGQSSGAYLYGVYETAKRIRKGVIVTLLNDIGERYMSTGLWETR